jgi:mevalonate kinase
MLGTYQACAKSILLGEHVVVYGSPALALPVHSVGTTARVTRRTNPDEPMLTTDAPLADASMAHRLLEESAMRLGLSDRLLEWRIEVSSTIPMGQGLGSSAALGCALVGALSKVAGLEMTVEELNAHVFALEGHVHGTPSGIDNTVVTYEVPIAYQKGEPLRMVPWPSGCHIVLASSGQIGSTRDAVDGVSRWKEMHPSEFDAVFDRATDAVAAGLEAFQESDPVALGDAMNINHECLQQLGVSTPALDRLVGVARDAGALGAKLTGAGLGGFIVVLTTPQHGQSMEAALSRAGAATVIQARVDDR